MIEDDAVGRVVAALDTLVEKSGGHFILITIAGETCEMVSDIPQESVLRILAHYVVLRSTTRANDD